MNTNDRRGCRLKPPMWVLNVLFESMKHFMEIPFKKIEQDFLNNLYLFYMKARFKFSAQKYLVC